MSARSATPGNTPSSIRSERVLVLASSLVVIAILSIVTFLLIREHAAAQQAATRAANNIVQLIDADVLRNVELYDLSLQGLVKAAKREDLKDVSPAIRHLALFDRATAAPYKGDILLLDKRGDVIADSASITPRIGNYADREYFQSHIQDPNPGMMISRPFHSRSHGQEWRISFSYRLSDERGEFMGVAEAAMRLSYFNQLFKSLNIGHGGTVNLVSRDGILLAQEPPLAEDLTRQGLQSPTEFHANPARRQWELHQHFRPGSEAAPVHFFPGGQPAIDRRGGALLSRGVRVMATHGIAGQWRHWRTLHRFALAHLAAAPRIATPLQS